MNPMARKHNNHSNAPTVGLRAEEVHSTRISTCHGFTLMELILVLFFMGMIAGLATPMVMSTLDRIELQSSARRIASTLAYARSQAVTHKTAFVFEGDIPGGRYWVTNTRTEESSIPTTLDSRIHMIQFTSGEETASDELFRIKFFPQGNSNGGALLLEGTKENEEQYVINIDAVTGKAVITQKAL